MTREYWIISVDIFKRFAPKHEQKDNLFPTQSEELKIFCFNPSKVLVLTITGFYPLMHNLTRIIVAQLLPSASPFKGILARDFIVGFFIFFGFIQ